MGAGSSKDVAHALSKECPGNVEMSPNHQNVAGGVARQSLATSGPRTNAPCSLLRGAVLAFAGSSYCSRLLPLGGRVRVDDFARGSNPDLTLRLGLAELLVEAARRRQISTFSGCVPDSLMGVQTTEDTAGEAIDAIAIVVLRAPVGDDAWSGAVVAFDFVVKLSPSQATLRPCCAMTRDATGRDASRTPDCDG